ncbi:MAG: LysR family transcriptional regulator [Burkholderiaceae bacterium]|nr:LysR family transcriptional regulator [Burkholderiaceae bacterium]MDO9090681.1 LysR family transcriptional regulator [Burkholderiaceae bacterium]
MAKLTLFNMELVTWIARLGSFTAAAERMHMTQPAVSTRIRELEEAIGQTLFVRQGRGIAITLEGREFVSQAEQVLEQVERLSASVSAKTATGVVRIGASSMCLDVVAALASHLSVKMPNVSFDLVLERAGALLELLEARKLDVGILSGPVDLSRFTCLSLGYDRLLWVALPEVLAKIEANTEAGVKHWLEGVAIWCFHRHSFLWFDSTRELNALGVNLNQVNSVDNNLAAMHIVMSGGGVGLLSERMIGRELAAGNLLPVPGLPPSKDIEFVIACLKESSSHILSEVMNAAVELSELRRVSHPWQAAGHRP